MNVTDLLNSHIHQTFAWTEVGLTIKDHRFELHCNFNSFLKLMVGEYDLRVYNMKQEEILYKIELEHKL